MAKKKEKEVESTETFSFKSLVHSLQSINEDSYMIDESPFSRIENYIDTGHALLNAQISGSIKSGIPEGRVTVIFGENQTGKTFLSLNMAKAAQAQGYSIVWFDSENALDIETIERFKIDPKKFNIISVNTVTEVITYITNLTDKLFEAKDKKIKLPKILMVLDSLGNCSNDKELDEAKSGDVKADMGSRGKDARRLMRTVIKRIGILKIPFIITNHMYETIGIFAAKVMTGGKGPLFGASTILYLSKSKLSETGQEEDKKKGKKVTKEHQVGIIVKSTVKKSRFTQPIDVEFYIHFRRPFNRYIGLQDYISWDVCGIDSGKINAKGEYEPTDTGRTFAVKHLNKHINSKELFTKEVFTDEVMTKLDAIITPKFKFADDDNLDEINELLGLDENEEVEELEEEESDE